MQETGKLFNVMFYSSANGQAQARGGEGKARVSGVDDISFLGLPRKIFVEIFNALGRLGRGGRRILSIPPE